MQWSSPTGSMWAGSPVASGRVEGRPGQPCGNGPAVGEVELGADSGVYPRPARRLDEADHAVQTVAIAQPEPAEAEIDSRGDERLRGGRALQERVVRAGGELSEDGS